nr:unnamed protein product [Callosobruchus analis]
MRVPSNLNNTPSRDKNYYSLATTKIQAISSCELPDVRHSSKTFISSAKLSFPFEKFSKLIRLKRVVAWILRFKTNCFSTKESRIFGPLTVEEINTAFKCLIKVAQYDSFQHEIKDLLEVKSLNNKNRLLSLNPYIDSDKILRDEHKRQLHVCPQHLLASLREQFWPILGRNLAKKVVRQCHPFVTILLLFSRLWVIYPNVGLSQVILSKTRVLTTPVPFLFVVLTDVVAKLLNADSSACHIELISDLTKDSLILFVDLLLGEGRPALIMSDNGTNFVAAWSEIKTFKSLLSGLAPEIADEFSKIYIERKFIPPYPPPHFGGVWKAGIKACKKHLKRVVEKTSLTFEELATLLAQVEPVLNSRPLFPASSEPSDLAPITPGHFLLGSPITALPERYYTNTPVNRLTRYQLIQQCQQNLWNRWQKKYVSELQQRTKWKKSQGQLKEEAMVLIKEDNLPPLCWKLGRIIQTHDGRDGIRRVATIRTSSGDIKRSFNKIYPLPEPEPPRET